MAENSEEIHKKCMNLLKVVAAQYKSRQRIRNLYCSVADFGFPVQLNYFETSHAKGEQDAAGSHVIQQIQHHQCQAAL